MPHSPTDPFGSARRRLARAKVHILDLKRRVKAFENRKTYQAVIYPHPNGIHEIYKLKGRRKTLPASFSDVAIDALENLRAALDHATYIIARTNPSLTRKQLGRVSFPFCAKASDFPSRAGDCLPGVPTEIVSLLRTFKPYEGGNNFLWALNELVRKSKHKSLTAIVSYANNVRCGGTMGFLDFVKDGERLTWDRANNEFYLGTAVARKHYQPAYEVTIRFEIAFEDVAVMAEEPIVKAIPHMARITERIIMGLESEARRLKLFS